MRGGNLSDEEDENVNRELSKVKVGVELSVEELDGGPEK